MKSEDVTASWIQKHQMVGALFELWNESEGKTLENYSYNGLMEASQSFELSKVQDALHKVFAKKIR